MSLRRTLSSTLFPYTTLFRSLRSGPPGWPSLRERLTRPAVPSRSQQPADRVRERRRRLSVRDLQPPRERVHRIHLPSRRSEEHTSELQSRFDLVCRLLLEKKK